MSIYNLDSHPSFATDDTFFLKRRKRDKGRVHYNATRQQWRLAWCHARLLRRHNLGPDPLAKGIRRKAHEIAFAI